MKAAFFHDTYLLEAEDKNIYSIGFGYDLWKRYIDIFSELIVCTRKSDKVINDYSKYKLSSGEHVTFQLNIVYKSPVQFFIGRRASTAPIKEVVSKVDYCIVRLPSVIGILAIQECMKQNKPWITEVVTCCWDALWHYGNIRGKILAPVMDKVNRYYISRSAYVIYVTREFLQKCYPSKGHCAGISDVVIEETDNMVLKDRIDRIAGITALRRIKETQRIAEPPRTAKVESVEEHKEITLGLIGSLNVGFKGHRTAIKAVKELMKKGYIVKLKCLGSGKADKWEKLSSRLGIRRQVEFCGTLPAGAEVLHWLDQIDIFLMPSLQEGLPRSMIEAMSRGCPVIGADTGGIPELIDKEFIVRPRDYKAISRQIIRLIEDKKLAMNQAKRNFTEAKKYTKGRLDQDRKDFYISFRESIDVQGGK